MVFLRPNMELDVAILNNGRETSFKKVTNRRGEYLEFYFFQL